MRQKAVLYSQGPDLAKKATLSVLSGEDREDREALILFQEQLAQMKETVNRLSFMMLEINSVLKNMPPHRPSTLPRGHKQKADKTGRKEV